MSSVERRTDTRILIRVPIRYRVLNDPNLPRQTAAVENISRRGFYFETEFPLLVGMFLDVSLRMPPQLAITIASNVRCLAHVVHVEPSSFWRGKSGIGLHIVRYEVAVAEKRPLMERYKERERLAS